MSDEELREQDAWIAVNLFGWDLSRDGMSNFQLEHARIAKIFGINAPFVWKIHRRLKWRHI